MKRYACLGLLLFFGLLSTINAVDAQTSIFQFSRDLSFGARGEDVKVLQKMLGVIQTGYFGPLTKAAVIQFQKNYWITPTWGYVGPKTRKVLNVILSQNQTAPAAPSHSQTTPPPSQTTLPLPTSNEPLVCNPALLTNDGMDSSRIINLESCNLLNILYAEKKVAGNAGDAYENRDNLHVNFCEGWTPNPDCPRDRRLFPQHEWKFLGAAGRATSVSPQVTIGQTSYAGQTIGNIKHGIAWLFYQSQAGADILYNQYTHNNLYIYPSLYEDSFANPDDPATLANPTSIEKSTENSADTPYVISSKQIAKQGVTYFRIHDASGSEFPFIKLGLAGLAALKPEVKQTLINGTSAGNERLSLLMPTLQALIRHSHMSVETETDYLESPAHRSSSMAHYFKDGAPQPAYNVKKLIIMANNLTLEDVPPLVRLRIVSETFTVAEKVFATPGAISRKVAYGGGTRTITVSAAGSFDVFGKSENLEYQWRVLEGSPLAKVTRSYNNPAEATIEFYSSSVTQRVDVAVFVKKIGGKYYSVPGIVSNYIHP